MRPQGNPLPSTIDGGLFFARRWPRMARCRPRVVRRAAISAGAGSMANVVCQVINQDDQMEFIWSAGGGFFDPYVIKRPDLTALRTDAATTREALEKLVSVRNKPGSPEKEGA